MHPTRFLRSWRLGQIPLRRLTFRFWIINENPCLVTWNDAFHKVTVPFCPLKEMVTDMQCSLRSTVMTRGTNFAETRRVFKPLKMACHVPYNMPTFAEISHTAYCLFARTNSSTCARESSFLLVES
jgi:hypothetical protein